VGSIGFRLYRGKKAHNNNKQPAFFQVTKGLLAGVTLTLLLVPNLVFSGPEGGQVVGGDASISNPQANVTQINQSSQRAVINWNSYNVAPNEAVNYQQPNASAITLNRINPHQGPSKIFGQINANGQVWLVNGAGIWFAPGSRVDVAGLVATTADISNQDFMSGNYRFTQSQNWNGAIVNEGEIVIRNAGLAALVGPGVVNNGKIVANLGTVVLGASKSFTIDFTGDQLVNFAVGGEVSDYARDAQGNRLESAVSNNGAIIANGGKVVLSASVAGNVLDNAINMKGIAQAQSVGVVNGTIILGATRGKVVVSGKLLASGKKAGEKGGKVKITGSEIVINDNAIIDVSGYAGGGNVFIGGNAYGAGPGLNASRVLVGSNVNIYADALGYGNGGNVVVWSDIATEFYGSISARGGSLGGDGGWVETSGKQFLSVNGGRVNLLAPFGATGTWLLDPTNIYIATNQLNATVAGMTGTDTSANTGSGGNPNTFSATTGVLDSLLTTGNLTTALASANVIVTTTNANGSGLGNITVVDAFSWSSANTLTLIAANNILLNAAITTGSAGAALILNAVGTITQTAAIGGSGGVTLQSGTATFSQSNSYAGPTTISAGTLNYSTIANVSGGNSNLGAPTTVGNGTIAIGATGVLNYTGTGHSSDRVINLTGSGATVSSSGSGALTLSGGVTGNTFNLVIAGTGNITQSGVIATTTGTLTKRGTGTLTLTGANTYSGATLINGGGITLSGASGAATSTAFTINQGGTLTLDNSGTNNNSRISTSNALTMNGGEFVVNGNAASNTAQSVGALTLSSGYSTITLSPNAARNTLVTFASLSQTTSATVLFRGTNLGANTVASATANNSNIVFTSAPTLVGAGGNSGTSTVSILRGAIGAATNSSAGTDFVTYNPPTGSVNGLRPLLAGEYTATPAANVNLRLTANRTGNDSFSLNSILLSGGVTYDYDSTGGVNNIVIGGAALSGNILSIGGSNSISPTRGAGGGTFSFGSINGSLFAVTNLTIGSLAPVIGTGGLSVSGAGAVIVNRSIAISGGLTINSGTLQSGIASAFSTAQAMTIQAPGTLNLNGFAQSITTLTLFSGATSGASVTTGAGTLTLGGDVTLNVNGSGTTGASISGNLALGASRNFVVGDGLAVNDLSISALVSGSGFDLVKQGVGTMALSGANTYSGATTVSAGTLSLASIGALGSTTSTSVTAGAALDVNLSSATLTNTNTITLNGTGINNGGALTFSGSNTTINNPITLNTASLIGGLGTGTMTLGGTISGAVNLTATLKNAGLSLAAVTLSSGGSLSVTTGGSIAQTAAFTVPGTSSFFAGANAITLNNGSNALTGAVSVFNSGANAVSLINSSALSIGTISVGNTLSLTSGGAISQSGIITATGGATTLAVTAASSDITLNTQANNFGSSAIVFGGTQSNIRDVAIRNINASAAMSSYTGLSNLRNLTLQFDNAAMIFPAITLTNGGNLSAIAGGAITQIGALVVPGTASFTAGANLITLASASNAFTGAVSLSNSGANAVSLTTNGALNIGTVGVGSTLSFIAGGSVSQSGVITATGGATTVAVTGASSNILLNTQANNFGSNAVVFGGTLTNIQDVGLRNINASAAMSSFVGLTNLRHLTLQFDNSLIALPVLTLVSSGNLSVTAGGAISQIGALSVAGTSSFTAGANTITLNNASNAFTGAVTFSNSGSNDISLTSGSALNLGASSFGRNLSVTNTSGSVTVSGNLTSNAGSIQINAGSNAITLNASTTITAATTGDSLVLAGNQFVNNSGASALNPGSGRFLVWSGTPVIDTRGGLSFNFIQYDATFGSSSVLGSGNGFLYTLAPTITPTLIGTVTKTYDATTTATLNGSNYSSSGAVGGDTVTLNNPTSGTYATANAGSGINVSVSGISIASATNGAATVYNYALSSSTANADIGIINTKVVNLAASRVYDGTANFVAGAFTPVITGTIGSQTLTIASGTGTVPSTHVSAGSQSLTLGSLVLGNGTNGGLASNYTLVGGTNTGTITAAPITASLTNTGVTKVYDGNTNAPAGFTPTYSFSGLIAGDTSASLTNSSIAYNSANVLDANILTVSGLAISGITGSNSSEATDYSVNSSANVAATITAKAVNLAASRVYDATANFVAGAFTPVITGTVGSQTLTIASGTGTVPSANVSAGTQTLTLGTLVLGDGTNGGLASNYTLVGGTNTGTINAKIVNLAATRVYDATANFVAGAFTPVITGTVGSQTLTIASGTGTVPSANVSAGTQTLTLGSLVLGDGTNGGLASNYTLVGGTNTGTINAKVVNLAASRVYDGTTDFVAGAFTPVITGTIGSQTLTIASGTGTVPSSHVSAGTQALTLGSLVLGDGTNGGLGSNYTLVGGTNTGTITAKSLTASLTNSGVTKVYDATTNAPAGFTPTYSFSGFIAGDTSASLTNSSIAYNSANVLDANIVTVSGIAINSITGSNSSEATDYTVNSSANVAATITAKMVNLAASRVYDATANFVAGAFDAIITGTVGSQTLTIASGTGTVPSANVSAGTQTLTLGTLVLGDGSNGGLASNYTLVGGTNTGTINAKVVNLAASRIYDGTVNFVAGAFTPVITGTVGSQTLTIASGTGTVSSANVSAGTQALTLGSLVLGDGTNGGLASNYTLVGGTNTGTINAKVVNLAASRVYDGTANFVAGAFDSIITGTIGSQTLTIASGTGTVPSSHVSAGTQTLTPGSLVLGDGTNGGLGSNYTLVGGTNTGTITAKSLTASLTNTGVTKVYDATTNAPAGFTPTYSFSGFIAGDTAATLTNSGIAYNSANVLDANTLTVSGLAISGITGSNSSEATDYTVNSSANVAATITAKMVNLAASRIYDGTVNFVTGAFTPVITGTVGSQTLTIASGTGTVPSSHVSAGTQALTLGSLVLGDGSNGGMASNYTLVGGTNTGTITPKALTASLTNTGVTKVYDATTNAPAGFTPTYSFSGFIAGDTSASLTNSSIAYNSANVLDANTLTVSGIAINSITGSNSSEATDYTVNSSANVAATITAKMVNLAATRVYDGTANFVTGAFTPIITGTIGSQTLTIASGTGTVPSSHVSAGTQTLTLGSLVLGDGTNGGIASNYTLVGGTNTGTITAKALTASLTNVGVTKVYDATTNAPAGFTPTYSFSGFIAGDTSASLTNSSIAYNSANVLDANILTVSGIAINSITGSNSSEATDYTVNSSANVGATITAKSVSLAASRIYDGTVNFVAGSFTPVITGTIGSQTLTIASGTGTVPSSHVSAGTQALTLGSLVLGNGSNGGIASNYTLVGGTNTGSITPKALTASLTNSGVTKVYDATTNAPAGFTPTYSFSGLIAGDTSATLSNSGIAYNSANVLDANLLTVSGIAISSITGSNSSEATDYTVNSSANVAATITAKMVNLAASRIYDGTVNFVAGAFTPVITGTIGSQTLTIASGTGTVSSANVSAGTQTLTLGTLVLGDGTNGGLASNYTLVGGTNTGTINAKVVNLAASRVYDGTVNFVAGAFTPVITGTIGSQTLTIASGTGTVPSANVSAGTQALTLGSLVLGDGTNGGLASNYTLVGGTNTGTINAKVVNLAASRVYDGSANFVAGAFTPVITGTIGSQTLTIASGTGTVPSSHVSAGTQALTLGSLVLGDGTNGGLGSNYTLVGGTNTGTITPKALTASLTNTGVTKVYDATTNAPAGFTPTYSFAGLIAGDTSASLTNSGIAYNNANVLDANTLTVSGIAINSITGSNSSEATDYTVNSSANVAASITAKMVNLAATRIYDGTANFVAGAFTPVITGTIGSQTLTIASGTATVPSSHVSAGTQALTLGSLVLGDGSNGGLGSNYTLVGGTNTGTITPKALTASLTNVGVTKVYDATTNAPAGFTPTYSFSGLVAGDTSATLTNSGIAYNNANVLDANTLTVSGIAINSITGSNSSEATDYTVNSSANVAASITAKMVNLAATRVYDGTANFVAGAFAPVITGTIGSQTLTIASGTATVPSSHVSAGTQALTLGSLILGDGSNGGLASNYTLVGGTNTGTITAKALTASLTNVGVTKVYDATTNAPAGFTPTYSFSGLIAGDTSASLTNSSIAYNNANVLDANTLTVSGIAISGITGSNSSEATDYTVNSSANVAASITAKMVNLAATRVYDGTANFVTGSFTPVITGTVGTQTLIIASGTGTVPSSHVSAGTQTLTLGTLTLGNGSNGGIASNYTLVGGTNTGTMTPKALTASLTNSGVTKVYDGTTSVPAGFTPTYSFSGFVSGDTNASLSNSGSAYNSSQVTLANQVTVSGLTLTGVTGSNGSLASDYNFSPSSLSVAATITQKALTISNVTANNKVYDRTTAAILDTSSSSLSGVIGGDNVTVSSGTGIFVDMNVGNSIAVIASGFTLGGTSASNYSVSQPAGLTANITPATLNTNLVGTTSKVYDKSNPASLTGSNYNLAGVFGGDTVNLNNPSSGIYANVDVGAGKMVLVSGLAISGSSAGNYQLASTSASGNIGTITAAALGVSGASANNKVYDGSTAATLNLTLASLSGVYAGDSVAINNSNYIANFVSANPGDNINVIVNFIGLIGASANNYLATPPVGLTANITGDVPPPPPPPPPTPTPEPIPPLPPVQDAIPYQAIFPFTEQTYSQASGSNETPSAVRYVNVLEKASTGKYPVLESNVCAKVTAFVSICSN
jgi:filamentous hemagglutinin family protein